MEVGFDFLESNCAHYVHCRTAYSDGKQTQECSPAAGNKGTTITAHDLFFNVPLRRRALKNANEEYTKIVDVVTRYAVHYPSVSFVCKKVGFFLIYKHYF